ncbi:MAG: pyridoxamine 5'-phosphate oxidase [Putridiphycobacter sp.]
MSEFDHIKHDHADFLKGELNEFLSDPMLMFKKWYQTAHEKNCPSPHAMSISTVDENGQPSSRTVYLKEILEEGFVFYTNYQSKKGQNLANNPKIAALFFWGCTEQQVRIEGEVVKVPEELSDDYFASRPRISQIGAWASEQSSEIENREVLEEKVKFYEKKFPNKVPRPPHWGGYLIQPKYLEFWQGRLGRLHDRICYQLDKNQKWEITRIAP